MNSVLSLATFVLIAASYCAFAFTNDVEVLEREEKIKFQKNIIRNNDTHRW